MASDVQDRLVFSLTDNQSTITILRSQRSDSGPYQLIVSLYEFNVAPLEDIVEISVKCKCNVFSYFLLETSTIMMIIIMIMNMRVMIFTKRLVVL